MTDDDDDLFSLVPDETMAKFCEKLGTSPELLRATVRELRKKNSNVKSINDHPKRRFSL